MALTALSKNNIIQTVFQNIFDRLESDVTSVNITGSTTVTIKTYTNSFPDKNIDAKGDYPILIVNSPDINWENFTIRKKWANGTFAVDILTTQREAGDKFIDAIMDSIETYRDDLKTVGMHFVNLENSSYDTFFRGGFKVHFRSASFSFKYIFTSTQV